MAANRNSQGKAKGVAAPHSAARSAAPAHGAASDGEVEVGPAEKGLGFERIVFFSDAVFAIAITLLALEIHVGEIADRLVDVELPLRLIELWPQLLGFALGFTVIGAFWSAHHRLFGYIERYDSRLISLNLLFLALVAISPFPANIIGEYGFHQSAQIFYAASVSLTGFVWVSLWWYASHKHRLVDPKLDDRAIRAMTLRGLFVPLVFLLSIPFTWLGPTVPIVIWSMSPFISGMIMRDAVRR